MPRSTPIPKTAAPLTIAAAPRRMQPPTKSFVVVDIPSTGLPGALRRDKRLGIQAPLRPFANPVPLTSRPAVTRRGPAPTPYYRAAGRRAPRSAPVAPRGSGRSRLAGPQRRTRPEARTQAQRPFRGVAWGPEITPHYLWKLWVTRVFGTAGAARSGLSKRRRRGATLRRCARCRTPQTSRQHRTYGGINDGRRRWVSQTTKPGRSGLRRGPG